MIDLKNTVWICTDEGLVEFDMKCKVLDGIVNPDHYGNDIVHIVCENGEINFIPYRRFVLKFEKSTDTTFNTPDINNTSWKCDDEDSPEYGMTCTVIDGSTNTSMGADSSVGLRYENGMITQVPYRDFLSFYDSVTTPQQIRATYDELTKKLNEIKKQKVAIEGDIMLLKSTCQHVNMVERYGVGKCEDCGYTTDNWFCKDSPTKQCDYHNTIDDTYDEDECIYCHEPDERK